MTTSIRIDNTIYKFNNDKYNKVVQKIKTKNHKSQEVLGYVTYRKLVNKFTNNINIINKGEHHI